MSLKTDELKNIRQRKYLAKDFDSLRSQILEYARNYYPDRLRDFSESSLGGLFLDMAAYVGDNMSFYLDHQYGETIPDVAVETSNIQRHLRDAGVPIVGAAPALVAVNLYIEVPAIKVGGQVVPNSEAFPIIEMGSVFESDTGTKFNLMDDVDFAKKRSDGSYYATIKIGNRNSDGTARSFILTARGTCISGNETTELFSVGSSFIPFREFTLSNANVTDIINVVDGFGNTYHQVKSLTHDVVYKNVLNTAGDSDLVKDTLRVIPAPYRFIANTELGSRKTTLTFGGGSADTLEDDVIPDPSEFAISFPHTKTFSRISVNPQQLLQTKTLGVIANNTNITVTYRYGGGLSHNVRAGSVSVVSSLIASFPENPTAIIAERVRASLSVSNSSNASGGEDSPTVNDLRSLIPSIKNSQDRIVTREDLLARVYSLPSNFGRVFRAAVRSNANNPLATQLFIISRDPEQRLITSPDTLKQNLQKFLNPYRLISDAIDVLDARVINLTCQFDVVLDPALNKNIVIQQVLVRLQEMMNIKNFQIDQPIIVSDVLRAIAAVSGIISIETVEFRNIRNNVSNRQYSSSSFNVSENTRKGIIIPPPGGIFEFRYPEVDIIGRVI
jgi:hypothetical protein